MNPFPCPIDSAILVWDWGKYLGPEALDQGVVLRVAEVVRRDIPMYRFTQDGLLEAVQRLMRGGNRH